MESIDKIFYINLDKRIDRNEHFLQECVKHNIPLDKVERFAGLDGNTYNFNSDEIKFFEKSDFKHLHFCKKIMGNQLSHYYIIEKMVKNNWNYILVFQDDIMFRKKFIEYIDKLTNNIPIDAELINIAFHHFASYSTFIPVNLENPENDELSINKENINDEVCILNKNINPASLGYLLTLKGAINMLQYFKNYGFLRATDGNFNDYLLNKNIFYGTTKILATGNEKLGTDIFN
jgi:GR25 family glycosyltransferase involved in LPS biosynthesis